MKNIMAIARREFSSSFLTPLAYVVISGFLLLSGFFFFGLVQQFNAILMRAAMMPNISPNLNEWVIAPFFQTLEIILVFLIPILTMRAVAEERRSGTFELLMTSPVSVSELIVGKFLGVSSVVLVMLLLSFIFPLALILVADPEIMPVLVGFLGILLLAMSFTAIGVSLSAMTKSQTVAGVLSLVVLLIFYVIDMPGSYFGENVAAVLGYLAPSRHSQAMIKGVVTGADLIYFSSVILLGLFIGNRVLDAERWR